MNRMQFTFAGSNPVTLEQFLRQEAGVSAQLLRRLKAVPDGMTRNGQHIRSIDTVYPGDVIVLHRPERCEAEPNPALNVRIVYETDAVLIADKPVNMPVHPSMLHRNDTLANWYAANRPDCGFHLINRLDRNTFGLCMIAKSAYTAHALRGKVTKRYYALVPNGLTGSGTVDAPIARERESVILRCVRADGRRAVTHYRVIEAGQRYTLLELIPETGRTHQIRVHMAYIGFPLIGDDLYGGDCAERRTHALCCGKLMFPEGETETVITLKEDLRGLFADFSAGGCSPAGSSAEKTDSCRQQ